MAGPGQPTKYRPEYDEQAYKLCLMGHTDAELATFFEVKESTINNWKLAHPTFLVSIKKGKEIADADVTKSLYERATGYNAPATKFFVSNGEIISQDYIEHYPPDPVSMFFWLKNRQPKKWRDKHVQEHEGLESAPPPTINVYNSAPPLSSNEDDVKDV